jgi:hypothetical protein
MRHPNQVLSRDEMLDHIWDYNFSSFSNIMDVHINNLRKKLTAGEPKTQKKNYIETVRGVGYRFKLYKLSSAMCLVYTKIYISTNYNIMRLGFIVILVGALYLLRNTHLIAPFAWDTLWPIVVILDRYRDGWQRWTWTRQMV